jgi:hypothetical protein
MVERVDRTYVPNSRLCSIPRYIPKPPVATLQGLQAPWSAAPEFSAAAVHVRLRLAVNQVLVPAALCHPHDTSLSPSRSSGVSASTALHSTTMRSSAVWSLRLGS